MSGDVGALAEQYRANKPFPHLVLDNFFDAGFLHRLIEEIPSPFTETDLWHNPDKLVVNKFALRDEARFGPLSRYFFGVLNGMTFLDFLSKVTGIESLIPDPSMDGAGFHMITRGGLLPIHADFNVHPVTNLERRLNILLYLNDGWRESYGGHLELWDRDMTACERRYLPAFNRMVIFATAPYTYHGHPDPLYCPLDAVRKSIALYYYTNGRAAADASPRHPTLWQDRPQDGGTVLETARQNPQWVANMKPWLGQAREHKEGGQ